MHGLIALQTWMASDPARMRVLHSVRALGLPDCWVAAGFVRNGVWGHLHQRTAAPLSGDIDVIWFDPQQATQARDLALEAALHGQDSALQWSVKNQARMHGRNGDLPYASATDAMRYWPETATAVGVRLGQDGAIEVAAPFGLEDLFNLLVRPTAHFLGDKRPIYLNRLNAKNWQAQWPLLTVEKVAMP
jgi:hypothetical protein